MLKRTLILLTFLLAQTSCTVNEEVGGYRPLPLDSKFIEEHEGMKREFLQLEEIKIGDGPIAAWGRKITADVIVRYWDGRPVYEGPVLVYWGLEGSVFIHNSLREAGALSLQQTGILLGLNGMAVGGKRRITIAPKLVCAWDGGEQANPRASCLLAVGRSDIVEVRKETLIVEAALTAACIPVFAGSGQTNEIRCRDSEVPQRDPSAPIWRFYHVAPSHP